MLEAPKNLSRQGISIRTSQNSPGERFKLEAALQIHDHAFGAPKSISPLKIARHLQFLWFRIFTILDWLKKLRHFLIKSAVHVKPEPHVLTGRKHDMLNNQIFEVLHPLSKLSH